MIRTRLGPTPLEDVVEATATLEAFPTAAVRIREVADDPDTSLLDLERAVQVDPAVSATVLRVANSAFYGLPRSVSTIRDALLILGFEATRDLALSVALFSGLRNGSPAREQVWRSAIRTGTASRLLATRSVPAEARHLFVAGLLHEVGLLILIKQFGPRYEERLRALHGRPEHRDWETTTFGWDHVALGAACLARWQLPEPIVGAVRWHHHDVADMPDIYRAGAAMVGLGEGVQSALLRSAPGEVVTWAAASPLALAAGVAPATLELVTRDLDREVRPLASVT